MTQSRSTLWITKSKVRSVGGHQKAVTVLPHHRHDERVGGGTVFLSSPPLAATVILGNLIDSHP